MNKGFMLLPVALSILAIGALISGLVTIKVDTLEKKVDIAIHKEVLKTGIPDYTVNK